MSGLEKLTKYIKEVKEESEAKIMELKQMIIALEAENQILKKQTDEYEKELETAWGMVQQLKTENARKWRVEEREDWKALVSSIQEDRKSLQEDNERLLLLTDQLKKMISEQTEVPENVQSVSCVNCNQRPTNAQVSQGKHVMGNGSFDLSGIGLGTKTQGEALDPHLKLMRDFELKNEEFKTYRRSMETYCSELEAEIQRLQEERASYLYENSKSRQSTGIFSVFSRFQNAFESFKTPVIQV